MCGPREEQEDTAYLQKPFTSQDLLLKVKQALAAGPRLLTDGGIWGLIKFYLCKLRV